MLYLIGFPKNTTYCNDFFALSFMYNWYSLNAPIHFFYRRQIGGPDPSHLQNVNQTCSTPKSIKDIVSKKVNPGS